MLQYAPTTFPYKHRVTGLVEPRRIDISREWYVWFGESKYHTIDEEPQWFLHAYCLDRNEYRDFALSRIKVEPGQHLVGVTGRYASP